MIGERLKYIRTQKKLSGPKMAEFLEMPYNTYLNYEKNERFPDGERLFDTAKRLGVSIDYLMGNSDYPERVEDFIKNYDKTSSEIKDEDFAALGLKESNVLKRLKNLPELIHEQRKEYESTRRILKKDQYYLSVTERLLAKEPDSDELKKDFDQMRCKLEVAALKHHEQVIKLKKLEEEYEVIMKLIELSIKQKETP